MYVLQIRQGHKSAFRFLNFSLKVLQNGAFLMFTGVRFHMCGPLSNGFGSKFSSFLIFEIKRLKIS